MSAAPSAPLRVTARELIERHPALLLDAYGVLNRGVEPMPGAPAFVAHLERRGVPYLVLTNDAARAPETIARRLQGMGVPVPPERVLSSGVLLTSHFARRALAGRTCAVLGTADSRRMTAAAGGVVIEPPGEPEVIVACDEEGYPFLETVTWVVSAAVRRLERGETVDLVLPNPDTFAPHPNGRLQPTAGAVAAMIESILRARFPDRRDLTFEPLGKPHPHLYEAAVERLGTRAAVMVGDQLATDVLGAVRAGLPAAVTGTELGGPADPLALPEARPTYVLTSLAV